MKTMLPFYTFSAIIMLMFSSVQLRAQEGNLELFLLKTYSFKNGEQEKRTEDYLKNALIPALKKTNINRIGVFKKRVAEMDTLLQRHVLIPFRNFEEFEHLDEKLALDQTYLTEGKGYLQAAHDQPPYHRISTTLIRAFKDMPTLRPTVLEGPKSERIYELRSYESPTEERFNNKVKMFNEGGEIALFDALGFNAVFYGEVVSGNAMPNLMYMTTFINQESRDAHWKAFIDSPVWKSLSTNSEYQNNVSHIDIHFLHPTEYSAY